MVKIECRDTFGFEVDDSIKGSSRVYNLPTCQAILAEKDGSTLAAELACASNNSEDNHEHFFEMLDYAKATNLELVIAIDTHFNGIDAKNSEKSLANRLKNYGGIVKKGFNRYFDGIFDEPEFVLLLAECYNPAEFNQFLKNCLNITEIEAKLSLKGNKPNYWIRTAHLIEDIASYTGKEISVKDISDVIEGYTRSILYIDSVSLLINDSKYETAIVQKNGSSFTYNRAMQRHVSKLTKGLDDDLEKSKAIFDWIHSNISYGKKKREYVEYRGALQVYADREGVCGESASLQVTMERLAGNIAFLAEVGDKHACAAHIRPNGEVILVDTTLPNGFNVKYKDFNLLSDDNSFARH